MRKNETGLLLAAAVSGFLFLLLIILVKTADVAAIGPEGTKIGLSHINGALHECFEFSPFWYTLTKLLGVAAIVIVFALAAAGAMQLVRKRSILKVDGPLLITGILYFVMLVFYVLFELVVVNYRPIIMPDASEPEASFPSSHTMLACVVLGSLILLLDGYLKRYIRDSRLRRILQAVCFALILIAILGRMFSGVHWFTDILGAVLLSACLLCLYAAFLERSGY